MRRSGSSSRSVPRRNQPSSGSASPQRAINGIPTGSRSNSRSARSTWSSRPVDLLGVGGGWMDAEHIGPEIEKVLLRLTPDGRSLESNREDLITAIHDAGALLEKGYLEA